MPVTVQKLIEFKRQRKPIVVLTAWDYAIASILDEAGVDALLVGDSLGMVALGYPTTLPVSLDAMIHHAAAVQRGVKQALIIADLPFLSYQESPAQAMRSAGCFLKEAGIQAVKLEGGYPQIVDTVHHLTTAGIPVMGHVGLTPQSVHRLGYRQQGKTDHEGDRILHEAIALEQAGAFAIVLEHIPSALAATITQKLEIPTIGIGAGLHCDGQVLVTADFLGLSAKKPPFAKAYTNLREIITAAVENYATEVRQRRFPEKL
ncbi:MAG: 3-methyl-2-oxobutanoate hydroxymethyltransferase [Jaaginema sp. PMC 1079.18]|nr:3-methyl-2-oxobutanoate hydroxymethyltransferase [Jaaginema sp. PMC 1080.18]MEC4853380.1 3-methyl-2-oxobutanoate hydroxymethyltransferase [Jaaginema sp. PMC 1079.18]MEC4865048.1 3-methyl-2-oxobutanoate hydroxymethyltransferase [Jaaginema sp. PMC 1078.18]